MATKTTSEFRTESYHTVHDIWRRIEQLLREKGWSIRHLEDQSGVARSTLYKLKRGESALPRFDTVKRLATALQVTPDQLWGTHEQTAITPSQLESRQRTSQRYELPMMDLPATQSQLLERCLQKGAEFDEQTNPAVASLAEQSPELFQGWQTQEWEELSSLFGVGGEMTLEGVRENAERMNERRELVFKLKVLMETELSSVAKAMIETLYQQVHSEG